MKIVGIDFGTTNVRVATWDTDQGGLPQPLAIGAGRGLTMPSVVAFQRQPGGNVITVVGEDADSMDGGENTLVIRNIKRWALTSDPYVRWHLEARGADWPIWWNPQTRCVNLWDQQKPVEGVIGLILDEALRRAGLEDLRQWRAGSPVHSNLTFRRGLAGVLSNHGGNNRVTWVAEEPILFLALAYRMGELKPGSYMVYDLGGGSFDCALAKVDQNERAVKLTVYAAGGQPLLGGVDIDQLLAQKLGYNGPPHLLRVAKEQLRPSGPDQTLPGGITLTWDHLAEVLREDRFLDKTTSVIREVYRRAKLLWNRGDDAPPAGEVIWRDPQSGHIRFVSQLGWEDMSRDLDGIILFGGPTRSPFFREGLAAIFGPEKVIAASDLISGLREPELTGLAAGACYLVNDSYVPLYIDRLPVRIILRDVQTGAQVEYEPYRYPLSFHRPSEPHVSDYLVRGSGNPTEYQVVVEDPDGAIMASHPVSGNLEMYSGLIASRARLVIDRFGRVWVEKKSGGLGLFENFLVTEEPPWQTDIQHDALRRLWQEQRRFEQAERERVHAILTKNPYGWQSTPG